MALATCPGAPDQGHARVLTATSATVSDRADEGLRIDAAHLADRAGVHVVGVVVVEREFGFGLVEPEQVDPILAVPLGERTVEEVPRTRMGGVQEPAWSPECHLHVHAPLGADQVTVAAQLVIVARGG